MKKLITALSAAALLLLVSAAPAFAGPQWRIDSISDTTALPGGTLQYHAQATSVGDQAIDGEKETIELLAELPEGMEALSASAVNEAAGEFLPCYDGFDGGASKAPVAGAQSVVCPTTSKVGPGPSVISQFIRLDMRVSVAPGASGVLLPRFEVSGGLTPSAATVDPVLVSEEPLDFGFDALDSSLSADASGTAFTQAGGHPYTYTTWIDFNTEHSPVPNQGHIWPIEPPKDVLVDLPPGFVGNPSVAAQCTVEQLAGGDANLGPITLCPAAAQVGTTEVRLRKGGDRWSLFTGPYPVFNMVPPPGVPARLGFKVLGAIVFLDAELRSGGDYGLSVGAHNIPQTIGVAGTTVTLWGVPASPAHTPHRACTGENVPYNGGGPSCAANTPEAPFFRMPTSCAAPDEGLETTVRMDSWVEPGDFVGRTLATHEPPGYPRLPAEWGPEVGVTGCEDVPVKGKLAAQPTTIDTTTPSGLEVEVEVPNPGLENPTGIASSDVKKVKVTLPEGLTVNPSQAEGLGACSSAQYQSTVLSFFPTPGKGCPDDSKIGTVQVKTPLLEETIPGDVYIAQPFENPFGSLLALYIVLHHPQRGILVTLAGKVETNPLTGQITTTFDDLPQLPFDKFEFRFREGSRAPLVTPSACGRYTTRAEFTGHSDPTGAPVVSESSFQITRGIGGSACPGGGLPPFKPGLIAGSLNNAGGAYSPFNIRLFRSDAEQEMTHFSIKLPPGIVGKLAGVPFCPDAAIAAAEDPNRTGATELATPSCPAASQVGRTLVGAGVGPVQTYVPGKVYLAGPYNGSALSIAAITAAKVGPFDLGTVVVRQALRVNPETAEVFVDPTGSDPIPHIIDGITTHIRDIRAYVDRPSFMLNPTSCDRTSTASTVLGYGLDFASAADDRPVTVSTPYQAAGCSALAFKPKLKITLKGGTKRGQYPSLRAELKMKGTGEAAIARAEVTLPHSAFLANAHIGTVCTRVQFKAETCPRRSVYGRARAITPLLDEALEGPVYLRSSENPLPDLVAKLRSGRIEVHLVGRIDSVANGQIRTSFEAVPDAPVRKFVLTMLGGSKGLLENSANLCARPNRARVRFDAHNGKTRDFNPVVKPSCEGKAPGRAKRGG